MASSVTRFKIELGKPLDFHGSLEPLMRNGDDQIERWDGEVLVRTVLTATGVVPYVCKAVKKKSKTYLEVTVPKAGQRHTAESAISSMFIDDHGLDKLAAKDPVIATLNERYPGIRPMLQPDPLMILVRCISAQQVNLKWATTLRSRLVEQFGQKYKVGNHYVYGLDAESLAAAKVTDLRALQFSTVKSEALISLAKSYIKGNLELATFRPLEDEEIIKRLETHRGVGRWTAEWFLVRALGRPRVAAGDLAVRKSVGIAYVADKRIPSEGEVRELTAHWGEAASIAQNLLLHAWSHSIVPAKKE